ncbi:MAG: hypothetical protein M3410_04120 [Acidobacteriota bacterium]|nr:hypothetical protein [Acidobacteriota bacterium]
MSCGSDDAGKLTQLHVYCGESEDCSAIIIQGSEDSPVALAGDEKLLGKSDRRDGILVFRAAVTYDGAGNAVEQAEYALDDSLISRKVARYDDFGKVSEVGDYKQDGSLNSKEEYTRSFDPYGNWTSEVKAALDADGQLQERLITRRELTYY